MNKPIASVTESTPHDPSPRPSDRKWHRTVLVATAMAALIAAGIVFSTSSLLPATHTWLHQASVGAPVLFVLVSVVLMSLVVPKTMISISAGALFGTTLGAVLVTIIAVGAASINYAIGRCCLSGLIERRLRSESFSHAAWPHALRDLANEGGLGFHLLFRFAPIPSMIVNYSMGAAGARVAPFLISAIIGVLPQLLWVHGGTIATIDSAANIGGWRWLTAAISIAAAIAVSLVIPRQVMRKIESMDG